MGKFTTKALKTLIGTKYGVRQCWRYFNWAMFLITFLPLTVLSQTDSVYQHGYTQYRRCHFDSAIIAFTQIITEHPGRKEGYYNRGLSYYHLNKLALAEHDFNACLQIDSVFEGARFMKAFTLQQQGDWDGANSELKKMNTSYAGYKELQKRIRYHHLSVILSRNWYYMIAIMFMFIILVGVLVKFYYTVKGY